MFGADRERYLAFRIRTFLNILLFVAAWQCQSAGGEGTQSTALSLTKLQRNDGEADVPPATFS